MKLRKLLVALPILTCLWGNQVVLADTVSNSNGVFQLSLDKNSEKLIKQPDDGVFFNVDSLTANQTIEKSLEIRNNGNKKMKLLFHVEDSELNNEYRDISNEMLNDISMRMIYKDDKTGEERVIYDGNLKGTIENIVLGSFSNGDSGKLTTYVTTPSDISSSWLNKSVSTKWVFQGDIIDNNSSVPSKPKTGDYTKYGIFLLILVSSGGYIVYSFLKKNKGN